MGKLMKKLEQEHRCRGTDMRPPACVVSPIKIEILENTHGWDGESHWDPEQLNECEEWRKRGECENNIEGMVENGFCAFVCRCKDAMQECPQWAAEGKCRMEPEYMQENCMKSCSWCVLGTKKQAAIQNAPRRPPHLWHLPHPLENAEHD